MSKGSTTLLGGIVGITLVTYLFVMICSWEGKTTAREYREYYREEGRQQVRVEAINAGVAEVVEGQLVWKTNNIELIREEIYDLIIQELSKRSKDGKEAEREEKGSKEAEESSCQEKGQAAEDELKEDSERSAEEEEGSST